MSRRPPPPLGPRVLLAALLLLASSCSRKDPPETEKLAATSAHSATPSPSVSVAASVAPPATPRGPDVERPLNVILILVDSLRADMPWNGYDRDVAPRLTAFAKTAVHFPHAYSLSAYTAKSVGGLMGARYPSEMTRTGKFFTRWPDDGNVFISEVLTDAGHRTLGGHAHGYFHKGLGVEQGFADWRMLPNIILGVQAGITGDRLAPMAIDMLSDPKNVDLGDKRFFAYFHFMDPHHTYEKHPDLPTFGKSLRDQYDHEVLFVDHWVGKLLDFIDEQPWAKQTAVIISADHGEGFGEHGHFRHGYEIWESVVHVPLLVRIPGVEPRTVEAFRSHIDLARTIFDLMAVDPPESFRGESLVPEMLGAPAKGRNVIIDLPRCNLQDRRRALITPEGEKLLAFGDDEKFLLFDLAEDPGEEHDLAEERPELFERTKRLYDEASRSIPVTECLGGEALKGAPKGRRW